MSRKLVFVNGEGETITFETSPYLIIKLDGLGVPGVDRQEQKAPYQDGTTYIDSLLQNRDIVVELGIVKPNNFHEIALYRRQLSQRLCPKYGQGTLTYTDEDGNSYAITAVPYSVVFPNKDYRDPYARAQVTFTANDPYWNKTTSETITLPNNVTSTPVVSSNRQVDLVEIIQLHDGSYFKAYTDYTTKYLYCFKSADGVNWNYGSPVLYIAAVTRAVRIIEQSDHTIRIIYTDNSYLLRQQTSADGGLTWSGMTSIRTYKTQSPSIVQLASGVLYVAFVNTETGTTSYYVQQTQSADNGVTWTSPVNIVESLTAYVDIKKLSRGDIIMGYTASMTTALKTRISMDNGNTWSAPVSSLDDGVVLYRLLVRADGLIATYYSKPSTYPLIYRTSDDLGVTWSAPSFVWTANVRNPSMIQLLDASYMFIYETSGTALDLYAFLGKRSIVPIDANIAGDVPVPIKLTLNGPSINPRIFNLNTLERIQFVLTLALGDSLTIDTAVGNKTIVLVKEGRVLNGIAYLDVGSTFIQLERGSNVVYYEDDSVSTTAVATMEWAERYVGV